jgi:hypothetical protein
MQVSLHPHRMKTARSGIVVGIVNASISPRHRKLSPASPER